MAQGSSPDPTPPAGGVSPPGLGGADQPAAVVDPERFAHQVRAFAITMGILAFLATVGAVLAVSVFR